MSLLDTYHLGRDVLGQGGMGGIDSFIPWLGIVGKVAGGATGAATTTSAASTATSASSTPAAKPSTTTTADIALEVRKALDAERQRAAKDKAEGDVKKLRLALIAVGIGGVGLAAWTFLRK